MFDSAHQPIHVVGRQDVLKTPRWLLPFTRGVDMRAIECVVRLAESARATLLAVSFVSSPPRGARLEHIQQSKDFLEAVQHIAARYQITVERDEVFTADVLQSLTTFVHERSCEGIVLVTDGKHSHLLLDEEVKRLLIKSPAALMLLRLSPLADLTASPRLAARFLSWWRGLWGWQDVTQVRHEEVPSAGDLLWIRTEQRHLGYPRVIESAGRKEASRMPGAHILRR